MDSMQELENAECPEKSGNQLRTFLATRWDGHNSNFGFLKPLGTFGSN